MHFAKILCACKGYPWIKLPAPINVMFLLFNTGLRDMGSREMTHVMLPLQASLLSGVDLRAAVKLPPEETYNDWVAIHGERDHVISV